MVLQPTTKLFVFFSIIALQLFLLSYTVLPIATVIVSRFGQFVNAPSPMAVTEFGMAILVRPMQELNAAASILVTEFGIIVFLHPVINLLDEVFMIALQLFLLSYTVLPLATIIVSNPEH